MSPMSCAIDSAPMGRYVLVFSQVQPGSPKHEGWRVWKKVRMGLLAHSSSGRLGSPGISVAFVYHWTMQPAVMGMERRWLCGLPLWLLGSSCEAEPLTWWQPMPSQPGDIPSARSSPTHCVRAQQRVSPESGGEHVYA